ncbi:MAG TPA: radical SAM protein [Mobilitalea sp.]|nr:radical SAM protein [Mobilitalea sp.]
MQNIWENLEIPENLVEYYSKGLFVVVDPNNACKVVLSSEEHRVYQYLLGKKSENIDESKPEDLNAQMVNSTLMKLIQNNIFPLKKKNAEIKHKTHKSVHTEAYLGLTDSCNFRCIYCYSECEPEKNEVQKGKFLSLKEYIRIIDEVILNGYKEIYFTGGEPLLNPYVFELAEYVKSKGLFCAILTNGSLISECSIEKFHRFDMVKLSLDSNIEEINDKTRGKGTYQKILRAITLLEKHKIPFGINSVLTNHNKDHIEALIEYISGELGVKAHTVANHIPYGRGVQDDCQIPAKEFEAYCKKIIECKKRCHVGNYSTLLQDTYFKLPNKTHCGMAENEVFINSIGNVYPCRMTYKDEFFLGNVLEIGLEQALHNFDPYREHFNVNHIEKCKDCNIKGLCGGGCRMLHCSYSGAFDVTSEEVCENIKKQMEYLVLLDSDLYES